jgi:Uma2 family endonuclease
VAVFGLFRRAVRSRYDGRVSEARRRATRADLEALPENVVGELIRGTLYTMPRPRPRHGSAASGVSADLYGPFDRGRGGPGGWWIVVEPGVELAALDVGEIVPDVAGWRRERLPELPERFTSAPDWVCEVLSPSTRHHDIRIKRPLYAEAGVRWMWVIDVDARTLVASRLMDGKWLEIGVWSDADVARIEPFDAIELQLSDLWGEPPAPAK